MSIEEREPKTENLPVASNDCFEDASNSDRLLEGSRLPCVDGDWTYAKDDTEVPTDKRFLVLGTAEAQQHWQGGQLVEKNRAPSKLIKKSEPVAASFLR
jgi:hypothetical protein